PCGSPSGYELGAPEITFSWVTDGCPTTGGSFTITAQARQSGDVNWSNPISVSAGYSLSPQVFAPCDIDFVAESATSGPAPLTVHFAPRNASAGITTWLWSFGDGGSTNETN